MKSIDITKTTQPSFLRCGDFVHRCHFCLCSKDPTSLVRPRWGFPPWLWLCYRICISLYIIVVFHLSLVNHCRIFWEKSKCSKYFIYLTNWNYITLTIIFLLKAYNVIAYYSWLKPSPSSRVESTPWTMAASWVLTNVTFGISLFITIIYWTFLFRPGMKVDFLNVNVHILNSVFVLLDLVVSAVPIRMAHVYQPFLYSFAYFSFSCIYWAAGGTDTRGNTWIYPILDWDKYQTTLPVNLLGGAMAMLLLQATAWAIAYLRDRLQGKIIDESQETASSCPEQATPTPQQVRSCPEPSTSTPKPPLEYGVHMAAMENGTEPAV